MKLILSNHVHKPMIALTKMKLATFLTILVRLIVDPEIANQIMTAQMLVKCFPMDQCLDLVIMASVSINVAFLASARTSLDIDRTLHFNCYSLGGSDITLLRPS